MKRLFVLALVVAALLPVSVHAADEPDLIFRKSTVFHWTSPNDKLATYAIDDPIVDGVACHFTVPEKGGFKGWLGRRRGSLRHLARLPPGRPDQVHGQVRAGRRCVPPPPLAVLQEDADRARLRREAQRARLHGLFGPDHRRLAEELDLDACRSCRGARWRRAEVRGLGGEVDCASSRESWATGRRIPDDARSSRSARALDRDEALAAAGAGVAGRWSGPRR